MEERSWHRHYDYCVPTSVRCPRLGIHELVSIGANAFPDKPALNFFGSEISFWDLRTLIQKFATALGALGVEKGERVGLHLPNIPQYPIAYYAALSLGAIVVNLNPLYTADEIKQMAETTGLTTLISFDMMLDNIRPVVADLDIPRVIVTKVTDFIQGMPVSTAKDLELEKGWHHFSEMIDSVPSPKRPRIEISTEDPAVIQFTGGTTGIPKGAVLTHGNVVSAALQAFMWGSATTGIIPAERRSVVAILPYFHVYGNIVALNWGMISCATQIMIPRFDIDEMMNLLANFPEITFFPAVPTIINAVINHPRAEELQLDRKIGLLNSGAAPMPVELIEQVKDMGIYFSEGFGMSESSSLGLSNPILGLKKAGSIGIPFPDNDVKLVNIEDGVTEVSVGEPGEMIMKGPLIMKEYWDNPEETAKQIKEGWLHTGDVAVRDEDDYLFIVDRIKDMIIAGGYNIYPREIDEVLFQHPKVADAVAVGISDQYRGETVKAFIVLQPGEECSTEELISFCKEKLAAYKVPKIIEFRDELPKSAIGKVLRKILRAEEEAKKEAQA
ncbi:MAG: long-chain fatty acid--CoA ligase [Candidatus Solincola sediminis]|uniref:Long-chain fatty acid--CoA ligase n=1 Tax=Candidatus Solincola sediminis TaxID=1797199 RepID=A0A1F2WMA8_9ACTN|nr:MAG: long-chain fatty acid--CoA ligase [Candidatus Solincola sediminis]OFW61404.1 MAG: long-chain fatty acid--CoA ligase [Candidatus Solincola sediminis]